LHTSAAACAAGAKVLHTPLYAGMNRDERERSVLVVEDDDATRRFLEENLAADGFRVATASGASEGIRAIEVRKPDLVVLDLVLEDGKGCRFWTGSGRPMDSPRASIPSCRSSSSPAAAARPTAYGGSRGVRTTTSSSPSATGSSCAGYGR
jgi:Response regulator receiver domain